MFNLIFTVISDIVTSLQLTRLLEFASLLIVLMLFCSPTGVATILGVGAKLGIYSHVKDKKKTAQSEA